jgi:hypothetical protein
VRAGRSIIPSIAYIAPEKKRRVPDISAFNSQCLFLKLILHAICGRILGPYLQKESVCVCVCASMHVLVCGKVINCEIILSVQNRISVKSVKGNVDAHLVCN